MRAMRLLHAVYYMLRSACCIRTACYAPTACCGLRVMHLLHALCLLHVHAYPAFAGVLELIDYIRKENIKTLIEHVIEEYFDRSAINCVYIVPVCSCCMAPEVPLSCCDTYQKCLP